MLSVEGLHVARGATPVLRGVDLRLEEREIVALIGPNGAGKTTLLSTLSGLLPIASGRATFRGPEGEIDVARASSAALVAAGLVHCPEGRQVFARLTVEENLALGAHLERDARAAARRVEEAFALFPVLAERRRLRAGALSGGEQMMLALARALMAGPRVLLLDEPSLGLAPRVTETIFETLARLQAESGVAMLVVEQNAALALEVASRAYVMEGGRIAREGTAAALAADPALAADYLGAA